MHRFTGSLSSAVSEAVRSLLTTKHLYQSVEVDTACISKIATEIREDQRRLGPSSSDLLVSSDDPVSIGVRALSMPWIPTAPGEMGVNPVGSKTLPLLLPTIHTYCSCVNCSGIWPHNPLPDRTLERSDNLTPPNQWFYLGYQCQSCKGLPVHFLVRREGNKLKLCGRDPIEIHPVPKFLPKTCSNFYGNAQIAHHAGQTLAGLFLLRVFIEQFWKRSVDDVMKQIVANQRATGEQLGDTYNSTLPNDFKARFPSLPEVYGKLSAAIHAADAKTELFEESCSKITEHFEARKLYRL